MKTRDICQIALLSASLTAAKLALAILPNIEVVTLLLIIYTLGLGWSKTFVASIVFVFTEMLIWGLNSWVLLYFLYWPSIVCLVSVCAKGKHSALIAVIVGIVMTVFFGVLSTFIELTLMGVWQTHNFWEAYKYRYISGIPFFLAQIISNIFLLSCLVQPLSQLLKKLTRKNILFTKE